MKINEEWRNMEMFIPLLLLDVSTSPPEPYEEFTFIADLYKGMCTYFPASNIGKSNHRHAIQAHCEETCI